MNCEITYASYVAQTWKFYVKYRITEQEKKYDFERVWRKIKWSSKEMSALYNKTSVDFRDQRKKSLAWDGVAAETGLENKSSSLLIMNISIQ